MSPRNRFTLNARCLGRALVRGRGRKLPHFLRGVGRALPAARWPGSFAAARLAAESTAATVVRSG